MAQTRLQKHDEYKRVADASPNSRIKTHSIWEGSSFVVVAKVGVMNDLGWTEEAVGNLGTFRLEAGLANEVSKLRSLVGSFLFGGHRKGP